jgi:lipid A 3-O-deacylase
MKHFYKLFLGLTFLSLQINADAQRPEPSKMVRVYEENDFFDLRGNGTDKAYSNGTRVDYFYEKQRSHNLIHKLMPKAGDGSKNIYGWSLMQIMVTPQDIEATDYLPNDFYYAGALFVTHSLYSYNAKKKYSFYTELLAGIRGPKSFADETQIAFHKLVGYQEPMGWDNQLRTQPLVNITLGVEKNLWSISDFIEVNAGSQLKVGSLMDLVMVYPMLRIGKMSPYFDGYLNQYGSFTKNGKRIKTQYYFVFRPSLSFVAYNAMLKGKRDNEENSINENINDGAGPSLHNRIVDFQFGFGFAHGNWGFSYMQTPTTAYTEGLDTHNYGNLSLYFRW